MLSKAQKLKQLRGRLHELEEVKLKEALARYGEAYQGSVNATEDAAWELADEEVSVLRAMIAEIKREIKDIEYPPQPIKSYTNNKK